MPGLSIRGSRGGTGTGYCGLIAQLVERHVEGVRVVGSIPTQTTGVYLNGRGPLLGSGCWWFESTHPDYGGLTQQVKGPRCDRGIGGSITRRPPHPLVLPDAGVEFLIRPARVRLTPSGLRRMMRPVSQAACLAVEAGAAPACGAIGSEATDAGEIPNLAPTWCNSTLTRRFGVVAQRACAAFAWREIRVRISAIPQRIHNASTTLSGSSSNWEDTRTAFSKRRIVAGRLHRSVGQHGRLTGFQG